MTTNTTNNTNIYFLTASCMRDAIMLINNKLGAMVIEKDNKSANVVGDYKYFKNKVLTEDKFAIFGLVSTKLASIFGRAMIEFGNDEKAEDIEKIKSLSIFNLDVMNPKIDQNKFISSLTKYVDEFENYPTEKEFFENMGNDKNLEDLEAILVSPFIEDEAMNSRVEALVKDLPTDSKAKMETLIDIVDRLLDDIKFFHTLWILRKLDSIINDLISVNRRGEDLDTAGLGTYRQLQTMSLEDLKLSLLTLVA